MSACGTPPEPRPVVMPLQQPVFIVGVNKSGTSLLYLLLSRHSHLSAIRSYRPPKPVRGRTAMLTAHDHGIAEGQKIPGLLSKLAPKGGSGRWATSAHVAEYRLTDADVEPGDREAVTRAYRQGMLRSDARLCEKSPPNLIRTRYLQALFPDALFVVLVRHPLATVAANGKKRAKWGDVSVQAEHWAEAHRLFLADRPHLRRMMILRYEDLVADVNGSLRAICDFCHMPFEPGLTDAEPVAPSVNDAMVNLLSADERAVVAARCGDVAEVLGYAW